MSAALNTDQGDLMGIQALQSFAVVDGNEPVACAMQDIGMAVHFLDPFIGAQVKPQYIFYGKNGQEAFHHFSETVIRSIQYQVAGCIVRCQFGCKATAHAAAINEDVVLGESFAKRFVHVLHIVQHILLRTLAGTLAKAAIVNQYHVIIITIEITRIFRPSFDAAGIAMQVKDQSFGCFTIKVQAIDAYTGFWLKEQFFEGNIVFEPEIAGKFFRFEDQSFLYQIGKNGKYQDPQDDINDDGDQEP